MGGCATLAREYRELIHDPWRLMKQNHFDGPDTPLHASGPLLTPPQQKALGTFFWTHEFHRLAVVVTDRTVVRPDIDLYMHVAYELMGMVLEVAFPNGRQAAGSVLMVFEHSQRGNPLVVEHFPAAWERAQRDFAAKRSLRGWRWPLPIRPAFSPKTAGLQGLEVADFVMQPAGKQAQETDKKWRAQPRKDFVAVFQCPSCDRLAHFKRINSVGESPHPSPANQLAR